MNTDNKTFLIRHGQSTFNAIWEATGVDPLHFDARLSGVGRDQVATARETARRLAVDLVVMSPLTRAIETGLGLFDPRETRMAVSALHRERLHCSCDVGRSPRELSREFAMLDFAHLDDRWWRSHEHADEIPVESQESFEARVVEFSAWLRDRREQRVAVVGHATFFHGVTGRYFENCEIVEWRV